jgi:hypothetical protein
MSSTAFGGAPATIDIAPPLEHTPDSKGARGTLNSKGARGTLNSKGARGTLNSKGARGTLDSKGVRGNLDSKGVRGNLDSKGARGNLDKVHDEIQQPSASISAKTVRRYKAKTNTPRTVVALLATPTLPEPRAHSSLQQQMASAHTCFRV